VLYNENSVTSFSRGDFSLNTRLGRFLKVFAVALCICGPIGAWLWFGESGFVRLYRTEMERRSFMDNIRQLAEENRILLDEIHRLRSDMKYVESVARKQLNLIKENEVIYRFEKQPPELNGEIQMPVGGRHSEE
jgi:cell division protein FtsB